MDSQTETDQPPGEERPRRWVWRVLFVLAGAGVGLLLGWLAVRGADLGRVGDAMAGFSWPLLPVILAVFMLSNLLRAFRWRLLWSGEVTTLRLFCIENAALGLNNVVPIRAADEAFELGVLTLRDRLSGGTIVATMMMSRIQDLAFTLLFIGIAIPFVSPVISLAAAIIGPAIYFAIWLAILFNFGRIIRRIPRLRDNQSLLAFEGALRSIWGRRRRVATSFAVTCSYWLLLAPVAWLIADGLGEGIALHEAAITVLGSIFFATAVPGLPGAVGSFEFAAVSLAEFWGVPRDSALAFAVILHAVLFLPPILFAVVVLPLEGLGSAGRIRRFISDWRTRAAEHREGQHAPRQ